MPGTGSDAAFARAAFAAPLARHGIDVVAVEPDPARVVGSYRDALDAAAERHGRILLGGISIGAAVAVDWAREHPLSSCAVLAALPPWTGAPDDAPAALSARITADSLRADGLAAVTDRMRSSSPAWLADTLSRSWRTHGAGLSGALDEAAAYVAPSLAQMRTLNVPVAIAAATDDAVHPLAVAHAWADALPRAVVHTLSLDDLAVDAAALGRTCLAAWDELAGAQSTGRAAGD
ncbi:hypothetical protein SAMN05444695_11025 [Rhodococcus triatomae]|uniref:Alpha/beta hydrolase n=2 Tax=Rhodococcus triatomae TaxID=300028 RepID=A0A1G8MNT5_9NOCA|nr:hypothetical protein SAMN05444695_11025 [Rhodococcus triatomae]